jgi:hypothetical protein
LAFKCSTKIPFESHDEQREESVSDGVSCIGLSSLPEHGEAQGLAALGFVRHALILLPDFLVLLAGLVGYLTGVEVSLSILYLPPVRLSAWFVGRRASIVLSIRGAIAWFSADAILRSVRTHSRDAFPDDVTMLVTTAH